LIQPILKIKKEKHKNPIILFIGSLIWPPNEDAVEWFSKKIFPKILIKIPNAEFHVVGKKKPEVINLLPKHPQIIIHGFQKNLNPYLKKADIFVLSFKMGGGVRIKSLTALSAGIPIVSTKLGVEGINLINNTHFLEANSETEFAEKVIKLLKSKVMQKQMSNNQKDYLKKFHSPKENLNWIKKYYQVL
jgi:glycosyltransferase involved in cell wall biosynthesis